jgi:hypothetical protein
VALVEPGDDVATEDDSSPGQGNAPGSPAKPMKSDLPVLDFSTLLLSLSSTALYQMGLVPDAETGQSAAPDRTLAHHTLETLELLREKTRGNLDEEETKLFESLLYELRMHFVKIPSDG